MENNTVKTKERLPWIDNLRMFAIVSVVLFHIMNYWLDFSLPMSRGLNTLIISFNMPVFFVLSGYVAAKRFMNVSTIKDMWKIGYNAFLRMLVPVIFFTLLLVPLGVRSGWLIHYWFMHSLFRLYVVVALSCFVVKVLPIKSTTCRLVIMTLLAFIASFVLGNYTVEFILYFIAGVLLKHYKLVDRISVGGGDFDTYPCGNNLRLCKR